MRVRKGSMRDRAHTCWKAPRRLREHRDKSRAVQIYRWKGKVESTKEFLLVIKSTKAHFAKLEAQIKRLHSYDVPEIVALPISRGAATYLTWISDSVKHRQGEKSKTE